MGTPDRPAPTRPPRSAMLTVFLVVFIDLLGFGIVLPLLPRIVDKVFRELHVSEMTAGILVGLIYSSFSLMQFIFAPVWGRLSDRVGRKPILMLGLAGSVVFYGLFAVAVTLTEGQGGLAVALILVSRMGAGIAGATVATAQAVIADCTTPQNRSRGMALIGMAFGIGFSFGPLVAAAGLAAFPGRLEVPGILAAVLSLVAFLVCWRKFDETLRPGDRATHAGHRIRPSVGRIAAVLRVPMIGLLIFTFFLATYGFACFESTLSLLTLSALQYDEADNFYAFAAVGLTLALAQGGLYRRLAKKYDEAILMRLGLLLMFIGLVHLGGVAAMANDPDAQGYKVPWFYAACIIAVVGFAFVTPSLTGLISRLTPANAQGEVLGVNQAFSALARILGPLTGLALFYATPSHALPYVAAGIALGVVMVLVYRIPRGVHGQARRVVVGQSEEKV